MWCVHMIFDFHIIFDSNILMYHLHNYRYNQIFNSISKACEDYNDEEDELLVEAVMQQDADTENLISFDDIQNGR